MLSAPEIATRIKWVVHQRNTTAGKMLSACGLSKNALSSMVSGSTPKAENLAKMASFLDVPTDFLLGIGGFENWETILKHKEMVLSTISELMYSISFDIANGVDDLSLIGIVQSFRVHVDDEPIDHAGVEIDVTSPYVTLSADAKTKLELTEKETELLTRYRELKALDQDVILGDVSRLYREVMRDASDEETSTA